MSLNAEFTYGISYVKHTKSRLALMYAMVNGGGIWPPKPARLNVSSEQTEARGADTVPLRVVSLFT